MINSNFVENVTHMEKISYDQSPQLVSELTMELNKNRINLLQHILLLASALLGLLAGLNPELGNSMILQISFAATIILLVLTILTGAMALYGFQVVMAFEKYDKFKEELVNAIHENRKVQSLTGNLPKRYLFFMRLCLTFFVLSLLSIAVYSLTAVFN